MIVARYKDVVLRELEKTDIKKKVEWINNPENNQYLHYDLPLEIEKTINWFKNKDNSKRLDCIIEYNGLPIGLIGLLQIDYVNRKAEYYITIGENDFKHKGIATKATKSIIEFAFKKLRLHKVYLTVDANNETAIYLYEKVGFKQEGYFVEDLFCKNVSELINCVRYTIVDNQVEGGVKLYYEITIETWKSMTTVSSISPTPVQRIGEVDNNILFIKREDLIPFSFGGNKARKAALFFKEIESGDFDCVVTYGSSSSNHCRVISNLCVSKKMPCYIISPEEASVPTFNSKMMELFGAEITIVPVTEVHDTIEQKLFELQTKGKKPYFIPGGGHGNIGTQAYVDCYEEIRQFEQIQNIHFDYIFHASGTGTTQAGMICGQLIHNDDRKIVGISIARKNPRGRDVVVDSVRSYIGNKMSEEVIQSATIFIDDYTSGYGKEDSRVDKTINRVMSTYGVAMDDTYTGKAFVGMDEYIKTNGIKGRNILFIHTGGTPLFFDYLSK